MRIERLLTAALLGLGLCACQRVSKPEVDAQIQQLEAQRMASEARSRRLSRAASGFGAQGPQQQRDYSRWYEDPPAPRPGEEPASRVPGPMSPRVQLSAPVQQGELDRERAELQRLIARAQEERAAQQQEQQQRAIASDAAPAIPLRERASGAVTLPRPEAVIRADAAETQADEPTAVIVDRTEAAELILIEPAAGLAYGWRLPDTLMLERAQPTRYELSERSRITRYELSERGEPTQYALTEHAPIARWPLTDYGLPLQYELNERNWITRYEPQYYEPEQYELTQYELTDRSAISSYDYLGSPIFQGGGQLSFITTSAGTHVVRVLQDPLSGELVVLESEIFIPRQWPRRYRNQQRMPIVIDSSGRISMVTAQP
ncbi:hypothetical protein IT575_15635 [bacterium]|nr:hypothetical protein [bacterium]